MIIAMKKHAPYKAKEKANAKTGCFNLIRLLPVIAMLSVYFLLVGLYTYTMPLSQFPFLAETDETVLYDCFSHIKMVFLLITASFAAFLLSYELLTGKRRIRKSPLYIPMAVYALLIVLSHVFSEYRMISLWGTFDRFEGTVTHLCYLFLLFFAMDVIDEKKDLVLILNTLFAAVTIASLIGVSQLFGHDLFASGIGRWLLLGGNTSLSLAFDKGMVYQTVYNRNYVAFYLCLVVPLLTGRLLEEILSLYAGGRSKGYDPKKDRKRIFYVIWLCILFVLIMINLYGAHSAGSLPGLLFGVSAAALAVLLKERCRLFIALILAGYLAAFLLLSFGVFGTRFSPFIKDISERPEIGEIVTEGDTVRFLVDGNLLVATYDSTSQSFLLQREDGTYLSTFMLPENEYRYQFDDPDFNGKIAFTPVITDEGTFAVFDTPGERWTFACTDQGIRYVNGAGNYAELKNAEHAGIIRNYSFGSGRGYIWDTTIPLLKKYLFTGSGADTFMTAFPQNDYATRYSHERSIGCVYDKPHNLYLQMAVQFGVAGLAAFLAMIVMAFIFLACFLKNNGFTVLPVLFFAGIAGFLMAALVNDSSVSVMPMFYGILGCALSSVMDRAGNGQKDKNR